MTRLSLIIPTFNRYSVLEKLLISISKQETSLKFEVIVVDNGSTDKTKDVVHSFLYQIKNLEYVYDQEPGLLTGRHKGLVLAKGEILSFLDDDVELNVNYIESVVKLFDNNPGINFATGPCLPKYEIDPPSWLSYFWDSVHEGRYCAWLSLLNFGDEVKVVNPNYVFGLNFCCRKEVVFHLGGFHPDCIPENLQQFQGDGETGLTKKAIIAGMMAIYDPKLSVHHHVSKKRMTHEYFKKWAFYKGVCDSYSQLRSEHFQESYVKPSKLKLLRNKLHPVYRWIKKIYPSRKNTVIPESIKNLQHELQKSTKEGYQFHQMCYYSNEKVRSWVLKENYWNYKLPI